MKKMLLMAAVLLAGWGAAPAADSPQPDTSESQAQQQLVEVQVNYYVEDDYDSYIYYNNGNGYQFYRPTNGTFTLMVLAGTSFDMNFVAGDNSYSCAYHTYIAQGDIHGIHSIIRDRPFYGVPVTFGEFSNVFRASGTPQRLDIRIYRIGC